MADGVAARDVLQRTIMDELVHGPDRRFWVICKRFGAVVLVNRT